MRQNLIEAEGDKSIIKCRICTIFPELVYIWFLQMCYEYLSVSSWHLGPLTERSHSESEALVDLEVTSAAKLFLVII